MWCDNGMSFAEMSLPENIGKFYFAILPNNIKGMFQYRGNNRFINYFRYNDGVEQREAVFPIVVNIEDIEPFHVVIISPFSTSHLVRFYGFPEKISLFAIEKLVVYGAVG